MPGDIFLVGDQGVESGEKRLLVQCIVTDLITARGIISSRVKKVIVFHPAQQ